MSRAAHASALFPCGHRRRRSNPGPTCNSPKCRTTIGPQRRYNVDRSRWRNCLHPRTPENSTPSGRGSETCATCKVIRSTARWRTDHGHERAIREAAARDLRTIRPPRHFVAKDFAPRPLPVIDRSERSYSLAPLRDQRSATHEQVLNSALHEVAGCE